MLERTKALIKHFILFPLTFFTFKAPLVKWTFLPVQVSAKYREIPALFAISACWETRSDVLSITEQIGKLKSPTNDQSRILADFKIASAQTASLHPDTVVVLLPFGENMYI